MLAMLARRKRWAGTAARTAAVLTVLFAPTSSRADVTLPPPSFAEVAVSPAEIVIQWEWNGATISTRCHFQTDGTSSYEQLEIHYDGGRTARFEIGPEGNGNIEGVDYGTVTLERTTTGDVDLRMRVIPTVSPSLRNENDQCHPSDFVIWFEPTRPVEQTMDECLDDAGVQGGGPEPVGTRLLGRA